jgi:hypothetical protein
VAPFCCENHYLAVYALFFDLDAKSINKLFFVSQLSALTDPLSELPLVLQWLNPITLESLVVEMGILTEDCIAILEGSLG